MLDDTLRDKLLRTLKNVSNAAGMITGSAQNHYIAAAIQNDLQELIDRLASEEGDNGNANA